MIAISATSAIGTPSNDNEARTVLLPGSPATYANRAVLREMGLRWDPSTHAWHGRLLATQRAFLERRYGLATRVVVPIESFEPAQVTPTLPPVRSRPPTGPRGPPRDYSRSRVESRIAFPSLEEKAEIPTAIRRFALAEITSGLPEDSRDEDERVVEKRLRDLRARVKAARALVSTTPGLSETLRADWEKAAMFYARFGITETQFRYGVVELTEGPSPKVYTRG